MKKLILLASVLSVCVTACPGPVGPVVNAAIDCLGSNRGAIDNILGEFKPLLNGGSIRWPDVEQRAKQAGREIGTCFVMELTQEYLSGTRSPADAKEAYDTAQKVRAELGGGATVVTKCVKEDGTSQVCRL